MKAAKLTILLIIMIALMHWMRGDYDHTLPMVLPFMHGQEPSLWYDLGSLVVVVITLLGIRQLSRNRRDNH